MAFDFPASPTVNQVFIGSNGAQYVWNGVTWNQVSGNPASLTAQARSRVINGAMQVSQENGNTVGTVSGYYAADQWQLQFAGCSAQVVRGTAAGEGYVYAQSFSAITASPAATAYAQNFQIIEGIRTRDFLWGTASAKQVILRFRAKSDNPGVYSIAIMNNAADRTFTKAVTLTTSFQDFAIVIPGETTGVWPTDNTAWGSVRFSTVVGSNYVSTIDGGWHSDSKFGAPGQSNGASVANLGAYVTNVGLYLDDQATGVPPPWVMPDEAQELAACQRYYQKTFAQGTNPATGVATGAITTHSSVAGGFYAMWKFIAEMRAPPAITTYNPVSANSSWRDTSNNADRASSPFAGSTSQAQIAASTSAAGLAWNAIHAVASARM